MDIFHRQNSWTFDNECAYNSGRISHFITLNLVIVKHHMQSLKTMLIIDLARKLIRYKLIQSNMC
jgi:hypothetical protein